MTRERVGVTAPHIARHACEVRDVYQTLPLRTRARAVGEGGASTGDQQTGGREGREERRENYRR